MNVQNAIGPSFILGVILFISFLYFIPAVVAYVRRHKDVGSIFVLCFFLGWTFIGWVVALIWAMSGNVSPAPDESVDGMRSNVKRMAIAMIGITAFPIVLIIIFSLFGPHDTQKLNNVSSAPSPISSEPTDTSMRQESTRSISERDVPNEAPADSDVEKIADAVGKEDSFERSPWYSANLPDEISTALASPKFMPLQGHSTSINLSLDGRMETLYKEVDSLEKCGMMGCGWSITDASSNKNLLGGYGGLRKVEASTNGYYDLLEVGGTVLKLYRFNGSEYKTYVCYERDSNNPYPKPTNCRDN